MILIMTFFCVFMFVFTVSAKPLSDISGHWAEDYINQLAGSSIMGGYPDGSFRPDANVTREEFVKCLIVALNIPINSSAKSSYADVYRTSWSYPYIETAVAAGILVPEEAVNGMLRPQEPIPRVEVAKLAVRALGLPIKSNYAGYDDGINIPSSYRGYVGVVKERHLMSGYPDGTFRAWNPVTRAEACVILIRLIYDAGKGAGLVTICYDHNQASIFDNAYPLHQKYGYPGVNYVIPPRVGDRGMMTLEQLRELERAGWETGSHSKNHLDFRVLKEREIRQQLYLSKDWLQENGLQYASFAYPFWFDTDPYPVVGEYYKSAVTCFGKSINTAPINRYKLERFMLDEGLSNDEMTDLLDQAVITGGWVIFYTHSVEVANQIPANHGTNQQRLEYLFQEIKKRGLTVVTISEGVKLKCNE
ncbi:Endoglucanase precursor [Sporotomaculum syntrophicum]|uniref:Endoglucanase n=1 Tax=Sporotomaculum syntrophicum TaxID=182264 RepID=A0A9D2WS69_9FIRM|nr:S-layer homology domain-containing protein [Sporotomaculum syntrophicum]KAF1085941.1 Endoglucanase precursor [Sporotomaculum syntrophicum]